MRSWGLHASVSRISCITCMNSLYTVARSLSLSSADGGGAFIRLYELIFALVHEKEIRGTRYTTIASFYYRMIIWQYVLSVYGMQRYVSFRAGSQERSARSVASLALRRSPSYKTRSAGYTTRSRSYLADERRRKEEGGKKKGREINLLFWNELHRRIDDIHQW